LPFPVICGFFAAVGILTWTLAVAVDTGGKSIGAVLFSGDMEVLTHAIVHHTPTVIVAAVMKYLGPKNPFYVIAVVFATIGLFYSVMFVTGVSLEQAKDMGWFWSHEELVYDQGTVSWLRFCSIPFLPPCISGLRRVVILFAIFRLDLTDGLLLRHLACSMK
jgi:hypothetical protein